MWPVIGRFVGAIALGAVGSTTIIVTLTTGHFAGVASGVKCVPALFVGSRDSEPSKGNCAYSPSDLPGCRYFASSKRTVFYKTSSDFNEYQAGAD